MEITIRRASRRDLHAFVETYLRAYSGLEEYSYSSRSRVKAYFKWLLNRDSAGVFVAEVKGEVAGFICSDAHWRSDRYDAGAIHELVVAPEYRRRGVARRLMEAALAHIKERGRRGAELWVGVENLSARRFYESLGFRAEDTVGKWLRMIKIF